MVRRWARRGLSFSMVGIALLVHLVGLPLWVPAAVLIDLAWRNHFSTLRVGVFVTIYFGMEVLGLLAAFWLWVTHGGPFGARGGRWRSSHIALQRWWSGTLFAAACSLLRLRLEVEGEDEAELGRGPVIVLIRHAGLVDVLLPAHLIANRHRLHLRYVLDEELLWDPCLDVVGHRLGNVFVRRSSGDAEVQITRIAATLGDLGTDEGVLIFPEGARFTSERRDKVLESLRRRGERTLADRAERLRHTMPPKPGGVLAMLEHEAPADVLIFAHLGLDRLQQTSRLFDGSIIGSTVRVRITRVPRGEIPETPEGRVNWLFDSWQRMDDWISRSGPPEHAATRRRRPPARR